MSDFLDLRCPNYGDTGQIDILAALDPRHRGRHRIPPRRNRTAPIHLPAPPKGTCEHSAVLADLSHLKNTEVRQNPPFNRDRRMGRGRHPRVDG